MTPQISSFGYSTFINDLFIGLYHGVVSDGTHTTDLAGNWVINVAKFDRNTYYICIGMITGYSTKSAESIWPEWQKSTQVYNVEFVSPVMNCPLITDSMMSMGNLQIQYRQQILDWAFNQI